MDISDLNIDDVDWFSYYMTKIADNDRTVINSTFMNQYLTEQQQLIIRALSHVYKIGGNLQSGVKQLEKDYPNQINAINPVGYGQKPNIRPKITIGEKRAIVGLVNQEAQKKTISQEEACKNLKINFENKFKKDRAAINKHDKELEGKPSKILKYIQTTQKSKYFDSLIIKQQIEGEITELEEKLIYYLLQEG